MMVCSISSSYQSALPDELDLRPGMKIRVLRLYDDAWGTAQVISGGEPGEAGKTGAFPIVSWESLIRSPPMLHSCIVIPPPSRFHLPLHPFLHPLFPIPPHFQLDDGIFRFPFSPDDIESPR